MVKPVIQCVVLKSDFDWAVLNPFAWNIWFLPVLFICSLFYMLLTCFCGMCRIKNKVFVCLLIIAIIPISLFANRFSYTGFFRYLQIVPTAMLFYLLGNIMKPYIIRIEQKKTVCVSIFAILSLCFCFFISAINTPVMMYANTYGNYLLFILCSMSGIFFSIYFSMFIKGAKLLVYIGKKSIAFYVWQGLIASLSLSIAYRISIEVFSITNANTISLLAFSIAIVVLYNIVKFTTDKIPQIYGYPKR